MNGFVKTLLLILGLIFLQVGCKNSSFGGRNSGPQGSGPKGSEVTPTQSPNIPKDDNIGGVGGTFIPETVGCGAGVDFGRKNSASTVGRVVISHDVNIFSVSIGKLPEQKFAVNVARWLTSKASGKILVFESNKTDKTRNFTTAVRSALGAAGYQVSVVTKTNATAADLVGYDAVFAGVTYPAIQFPFSDPNVLVNYVRSGGGVYMYSGVGTQPAAESAKLNPFTRSFGFEYGPSYNNLTSVTINSSHPIFTCISTLGNGIGHNIVRLSTASGASQSLQSAAGGVVFAVYDETSN